MGGGGGGSAPSEPIPQSYGGQPNYIPTNQPGMDTNYQGLMTNYMAGAQPLGSLAPSAATAATTIQNNPYASQIVPGAQQAQGIAQNIGVPQMQGGSQALYGAGQQALPYATQALNQGFDPQQSLYNQQYQQMQDQQNAQMAMGGVAGSPYAAGLENQASTNFNNQWQNQQLSRESQAANTYNTLVNQSGQDFTGAGMLAQQASQTAYGAGQLPYQGYNVAPTTDLSTIGTAGSAGTSALGSDLSGMNAAGNYLGLGNSASSSYNTAVNNAYQEQMQAYAANNQANAGMFGGIGSMLGGIGGMFTGGNNLFGSISNPFSSGSNVFTNAGLTADGSMLI